MSDIALKDFNKISSHNRRALPTREGYLKKMLKDGWANFQRWCLSPPAEVEGYSEPAVGQDVLNLQDVTFTRHFLNMAAHKVESLIAEVKKKKKNTPVCSDSLSFWRYYRDTGHQYPVYPFNINRINTPVDVAGLHNACLDFTASHNDIGRHLLGVDGPSPQASTATPGFLPKTTEMSGLTFMKPLQILIRSNLGNNQLNTATDVKLLRFFIYLHLTTALDLPQRGTVGDVRSHQRRPLKRWEVEKNDLHHRENWAIKAKADEDLWRERKKLPELRRFRAAQVAPE